MKGIYVHETREETLDSSFDLLVCQYLTEGVQCGLEEGSCQKPQHELNNATHR